ncbi:hypothetical protein [Pseudoalteromonas rubra]|uniref:hypothetical protein n=1 Tax=Pseudoalteromonas rubra TaxID=43658 RepID=UPI000F77DED6|nr:hypothetical protein [Pseudoalteromonas rubra]
MLYTLIGMLAIYLVLKLALRLVISYRYRLKKTQLNEKIDVDISSDGFDQKMRAYKQKVPAFIDQGFEMETCDDSIEIPFKRVVEAFASGDTEQIQDICSDILNLTHEPTLKALASRFDEFRRLVANLPVERSYGRDYRFTALRASNYLGDVSRGWCKCKSFNSGNSFFPQIAAKKGDIKIIETIKVKEDYSTTYKYECLKCGAISSVNVNMGGHAPFTRSL